MPVVAGVFVFSRTLLGVFAQRRRSARGEQGKLSLSFCKARHGRDRAHAAHIEDNERFESNTCVVARSPPQHNNTLVGRIYRREGVLSCVRCPNTYSILAGGRYRREGAVRGENRGARLRCRLWHQLRRRKNTRLGSHGVSRRGVDEFRLFIISNLRRGYDDDISERTKKRKNTLLETVSYTHTRSSLAASLRFGLASIPSATLLYALGQSALPREEARRDARRSVGIRVARGISELESSRERGREKFRLSRSLRSSSFCR